MRISALLLVGGAMIATAQAQSGATSAELHPMPRTLPLMFFSPNSLAGTMLGPLEEPETASEAGSAAGAAMDAGRALRLVQAAPEIQAQTATEEPAEAKPESAALAEPATEPDAAAPEPQSSMATAATVHVIIENVESGDGTVNVAVCDTSLSQEGCPYFTKVPASPGFVEAQIDDIPPGVYAVVGYHDVNSNDEFDQLLGVPREPYALSGAAGDTLIPEFSDAALNINPGVNYVIIRMRRLGGD